MDATSQSDATRPISKKPLEEGGFNSVILEKQNRDKLEVLFEMMPVGISILNSQLNVVKVNSALGAILDLTRDELITGKFKQRSYLHADGTSMPPEEFPSARAILEKKAVSNVEVGVVKDNGEIIWTNVSAVPFPFEDWNIIVVTTDITQRKRLEEQLSINTSIVASTNDAILTKDLDGLITSWNAGAEKAYGYTAAEMIGQPDSMLVPPENVDEEPGILNAIRQGKTVDRLVTSRRRKDGVDITVSLTISPVIDAAGRIYGAASIARDISDQIKVDEELQAGRDALEKRVQDRTAELVLVVQALQDEIGERKKAEDALHVRNTALETAANGIIITDHQGRIMWSNQAFTEMTGYSAEEMLGRDTSLLKSGKQTPDFYRQMWETILAGKVWRGEIINRRKDGSLYPEEQTITPVLAENGKLSYFIAIKQDVTERKRAEAQVLEEAARANLLAEVSKLLVESGSDFQPILDKVASLIAVSIGDFCIINLLNEDGQTYHSVAFASAQADIPPKLLEMVKSNRHTDVGASTIVLKTGQPLLVPELSQDDIQNLIRTEFIQAFGQIRLYSLLIVPLRAQGKILGTLSLSRIQSPRSYTLADQAFALNLADRLAMAITNARLYAELEKALQDEQTMRTQVIQTEKFSAMGRMLASITHELNNPLQTIKNCLYLTRQEIPAGTSYPYLDIISDEIQRLSLLVSQLREVYRPRNLGQKQPVDLVEILGQVKGLVAHHMLNSHVAWQQTPSGAPLIVLGAVDQLKQVFLNISINAIESMEPDGGCLNVDLFTQTDAHQVGVSFQDTGPGIAPEHLPRLFEPLFTTKHTGLGLGLSICYDIIIAHGGKITVDSQLGQGSNFTIWLPEFKVAVTSTGEV